MTSARVHAGFGSIAAFLLAAAPPAMGAGMETMGYEWAAWTGPWQFGFGLICLLVGAGLGCYALGLVRPMLRFRVSYHDAAVKFYDRADPRLRELIATLNGPDVLGGVDKVSDPQSDGCDQYEAEEAVGGLVISGGQPSAVFEL